MNHETNYVIRELPGGGEFGRRLPKITSAYLVSGKNSDKYVYNGKHVPNEKLIGTWEQAIYLPSESAAIDKAVKERLRTNNNKLQVGRPKDTVTFGEGGSVSKSNWHRGYFWSGDRLISVDDGLALRMEVRTYDGVDVLLIERKQVMVPSEDDDGTEGYPPDWHPQYHGYARLQQKGGTGNAAKPSTQARPPTTAKPLFPERTWTSAEGKTTKAAILSLTGNKVKMKLPNGRVLDYPIEKLSKADQKLIRDKAGLQ